MPIKPAAAQLIAINEAIRCIDFDSIGETPVDELVADALDFLLEARARLTDRPWPEFAALSGDEISAWLDARAAEQITDGRL